MVIVAFIASIVLTSAVASLIQVDTGNTRSNQPDYHLVPFAGDAFGA